MNEVNKLKHEKKKYKVSAKLHKSEVDLLQALLKDRAHCHDKAKSILIAISSKRPLGLKRI